MAYPTNADGQVKVVAKLNGIKDNGHEYKAGQVFRMHPDLVGPAISAGQVSVASQQAQGTPNDRQATGGVTK